MCTIEIEPWWGFFWRMCILLAVHLCNFRLHGSSSMHNVCLFLWFLVCDMLLGAVCSGYNSPSNMHLSEVSFAGVRVCACGCALLFVAEEKDCCFSGALVVGKSSVANVTEK